MPTSSRQPRAQSDKDLSPLYLWTMFERQGDAIPSWGSTGRDGKLREFAQQEPILAGAVATMSSKATALDWQIIGGRNRASRFHAVLGEAEDGQGWSYWLDRLVQDYVMTDIGGLVELARESTNGPVTAIYNLDSTACQLTGNSTVPVKYRPKVGATRTVPLYPGDFARVVDMPSNDEARFGLGYCAVSRALKAAKVLMALYQYEEEQLSDLPPQGIASITGMTAQEIKQAFDLYEARRNSKEQQTFKGVLWLAATSNALQPVGVNLTSFASLPDHFDKDKAMTLYVYTLALDFGVDVREFWPASQTGATKGEAEIQHQKAKGKGFGRMLSDIERAVNWEVLPSGLEFAFDQQDSGDDLLRFQIQKEAIAAVRSMWEPAMGAEGLISTDEARRLLVENGVLPEWAALTDDVVETGMAKALDKRVEKARLQPGEDLVAINSKGDVATLWSSRKTYSIQLPVDEVAAPVPFDWARAGFRYP